MTTMLTYSGLRIDLVDPKPEQISMVDIAHHLAHICRFTGAVSSFYSVAQHSVLVASLVPTDLTLPALLHDAHEAYLGDVATPLKQALCSDQYKHLAAKFDIAISLRFGIDREALRDAEVKRADLIALATERRDFMPPDGRDIWPGLKGVRPDQKPLHAWAPDEAKEAFLRAASRWLGV
jgi:uncharacterized protein